MDISYAPLRLRSNYSLLAGTMSLHEIVDRASQTGLEAVALTDVNNLYGAVEFGRLARERGIKAVIGAELRAGLDSVVLLARDRRGYKNLCRAITRLSLGDGSASGVSREIVHAPGAPEIREARPLDPEEDAARGYGSSSSGDIPRRPNGSRGGAPPHSEGSRRRPDISSLSRRSGPGQRPDISCPSRQNASGQTPSPLFEILAGGVEGLHCVVEDAVLAETLAYLFPRDRLWLELAAPGRTPEMWERNVRVARDLGAGVVATGDTWFGAPEDWSLHRALRAVAGRTLVTRAGTADGVAHPNSFLATRAQMARRLGGYSWALCQAAAVAEDCNLNLETAKHLFPSCSLGLGETPRSRLAAMCGDGMRTRFGASPHPRVRRRLERELDVIDKLGFCAYFVVVGEIVEWARRRGISALGRGSGASSLVAYLLGITGVDPLRYGLCFERFLNSSRPDYPDLDVDLCWRRRDEVIQHVYDTYGDDRVAMISTHVTFRRRSALREMAKVWGLVPEDVSKAVRSLGMEGPPPSEGETYERTFAGDDARAPGRRPEAYGGEFREAGPDRSQTVSRRDSRAGADGRATKVPEPLRTVLAMAHRIHGFPRHLGIHCGGIVIAPGPLRDIVPLERATKGVVVTQYEMDAVERIGLVKMDLLGNRGLTVAQDCIELANARGGSLALEEIPDGDPAAAEVLAKGDTLGCFQIESPAMRQLLVMVEPRNSDEVIASVALVRPGPAGSGMKDAFVRRKRGLEKASFAHPCITPVLSATYGVMLYEEDVLKVAAVAAGVSLEDGDDLRRAISQAKDEGETSQVRSGFLELVERRGIPRDAAEALWGDLERFSSYAFCKAHASGYGLLAYRSAYLKAHFPVEFAVAVLNNHAGMYPTRVHLEDARRRNVEIRGPCVNRSEEGFIAEGNAVRVGLGRLKGMRAVAVSEILEARRRSPFNSLTDLLGRVSLTAPEAESLVLAGALDFTGLPRPSLLLEVLAWAKSRGKTPPAPEPMLDGFVGTPCLPRIGEFDPQLRLEMEGRHLGLTPSGHPMQGMSGRRGEDCPVEEPFSTARSPAPAPHGRSSNSSSAAVACDVLRRHLGRKVTVLGVVSAFRRIRTEAGEPMLFLTVEDATGLVESVVFPDVYRTVVDTLEERGPLAVTGRVEDHYGALTLVAEGITPASRQSRRGGRGQAIDEPDYSESEHVEGQRVRREPDYVELSSAGGQPSSADQDRPESGAAGARTRSPELEAVGQGLEKGRPGSCAVEIGRERAEAIEGSCAAGRTGWPYGGG